MTAGLANSSAPTLYRQSMRSLARRHFAWKEFRQDIPLLIIFAVVLCVTLACMTLLQTPEQASRRMSTWTPVVWVFINVFSLTMGVFLFAPEKENRTAQLLSQLPATSGFFVRWKLLIGAIVVLGFITICVALQFAEVVFLGKSLSPVAWRDDVPDWIELLGWSGFAVFIPAEVYLIAAFTSLVIKRTIFAVVASTAGLMISWMVPAMIASVFPVATNQVSFSVVVFVSIKALILIGVVIGLISAGRNWLGNAAPLGQRPPVRTNRLTERVVQDTAQVEKRANPVPSSMVYSSLIWQSFRQYKKILLWAIFGAIPLAFFLSFAVAAASSFQNTGPLIFFALLLFVTPLVGSLLAFSNDQYNGNFRFFQQHVEHGRKLWLARLLPPALLSVVCVLALVFSGCGFDFLQPTEVDQRWALLTKYISLSVLAVFAAFCIGQFCSMIFQSSVFAFLAVLILVSVMSSWGSWLFYLETSLWLFVAPILLGMLAITWWRAPAWLASRARWREHVVIWGSLSSVIILNLIWFGCFRIVTIPNSVVTASQIQHDYLVPYRDNVASVRRTSLLADAADLCQIDSSTIPKGGEFDRASEFFAKTSPDFNQSLQAFLDSNQASLDLIDQADLFTARTGILETSSITKRKRQVQNLRYLMAAKATMAELNGDLKAALDHWIQLNRFDDEYPVRHGQPSSLAMIARWSELPNQQPKLIQAAIDTFSNPDLHEVTQQKFQGSRLDQLDLANWYSQWKSGKTNPEVPSFGVMWQNWPARLMPWEQVRSRRIASLQIDRTSGNHWWLNHLASDHSSSCAMFCGTDFPYSLKRFAENGLSQLSHRPNLFYIETMGTAQNMVLELQAIQMRRYLLVRLALRQYFLKRNRLPENLEELAPDYLAEVPVDVFYGQPFLYYPKGTKNTASWNDSPTVFVRDTYSAAVRLDIVQPKNARRIPRETPFVMPWSNPFLGRLENIPFRPNVDVGLISVSDPHSFVCQFSFYDQYHLNWEKLAARHLPPASKSDTELQTDVEHDVEETDEN